MSYTYEALSPGGHQEMLEEVFSKVREQVGSYKSASGSLVSFDDGADLPMPSFICNISAQQDLHGQDAPWVGGAGKNKLENKLTTRTYNGVTATVKEDGTVTLTGTATTATNFFINTELNLTGNYIISGCPSGGSENSYYMNALIGSWGAKGKDTGDGIYSDGRTITNVAITVANGYSFPSDGITFKPMIESGNTKTSFAPYSNICPISGHTGLDAWVRGKNLVTKPVVGININSITGKIYGTPSSQAIVASTPDLLPITFRSNENYILSRDVDTKAMLFAYNENKEYMGRTIGNANNPRIITANAFTQNTTGVGGEISYIALRLYSDDTDILQSDIDEAQIQLEKGSTATTYEPYNPNSQTIQVSWQTEAGEVFGGYVDLVSGELTVDRVLKTLVGTETWTYTSMYNRIYTYISDAKKPSGAIVYSILSDKLHFSSGVKEDYGAHINNVGNLIVFAPSSITSADQWKTWLASNNVQVVYELATPQTIQLTLQQIKSLLGNNNAWCSTGDIKSLQYQPNNIIAELRAEILALQAQGFMPVQNNAGYHNSIYRGKSLGTSITAEQWAAIRAGTFEDMYIGDYWTLLTTFGETTSNVQYVIAGFDYWWNCGDSYPQTSNYHHIVLVPATNLYSAKMNDSNITTGGYVGSKMYTDYLANARTGISTLFGDHLYSVRRPFVNEVNAAGQGTAWSWYTSSVDLMNETMVYGHPVWTTSGFEVGVDRTILPLFALNPASVSIRSAWWLRCAATSANFAYVISYGNATSNGASNSYGVRTAFAIY